MQRKLVIFLETHAGITQVVEKWMGLGWRRLMQHPTTGVDIVCTVKACESAARRKMQAVESCINTSSTIKHTVAND